MVLDNFSISLKSEQKFKLIPYDIKKGGFDGIYLDKNSNIVIVIKKTGGKFQNFGIELLSQGEGSIDWIDKILIKMSDPKVELYTELNSQVALNIHRSILNQKLRVILDYQRTDREQYSEFEPNYYLSELKDNNWKYIDSFPFNKEEGIPMEHKSVKTTDEISFEEFYRLLTPKKREDPNYPNTDSLLNLCKQDFKFIQKNYQPNKDYNFFLYIELNSIANEFNLFSFISKYIDGGNDKFLNGMFTCSRLKYLAGLNYPEDNGLINFIFSIAINDQKTIDAYIKNYYESDNKDKHLNFYSVFIDSLLTVFKTKPHKDITDKINSFFDNSKINKYEKSFLTCLKCIITHEYSNFQENFDYIINNHRLLENSDFSQNSKVFLSFPAIAIFNLVYFDKERTTPMPPEPNNPIWDSELWHEIIKENQKREYLINLSKISPVLKRWIDELPSKIEIKELLEK